MLVRSINVKPSVWLRERASDAENKREWAAATPSSCFLYRESELKTILLSSGIKCIEFHLWHCTQHHSHTHTQLADWLTDLREKWNETKRETRTVCSLSHKRRVRCTELFVLCSDGRMDEESKRCAIIAFHFSFSPNPVAAILFQWIGIVCLRACICVLCSHLCRPWVI